MSPCSVRDNMVSKSKKTFGMGTGTGMGLCMMGIVGICFVFVCIAMFLLGRHSTAGTGTGTRATETVAQPLVVERVVTRVVEERTPTRGDFKQIGLLVGKDGPGEEPPVMLPLFGRKMTHRDRYEYYTATDKEHLWKVPVQFEHRECQDELGCAEIYDGVDVVVPDYANKTFRARIYKNAVAGLRY